MRSRSFILLTLVAIFFFSCADDLTNVGVSIQPGSDEISVNADTFHVVTENVYVDSIYTRQDSFLLGTFYNNKYGSTTADILAQVECPVGYKFPSNAVADSAIVYMYYTTWFGDDLSPMDVSIYEMNVNTFKYSEPYYSNLNVANYCDKSKLLSHRLFTASGVSTATTKAVKFPLPKTFVDRLSKDSLFMSSDNFLKSFGGFYITSSYGSSAILNVSRILMQYYYHHTISKNGKDTTIVTAVPFPANEWVRQVNRYVHEDRSEKAKLRDTINYNYVSSPANLETRIKIPLARMNDSIYSKLANKKLSMNSALLKVEVAEIDDSSLPVPLTSYLLLIKESAMKRFFENNELPNDTCAILGKYNAVLNDSTNEYDYYYSFNTAKLVANEIKNKSYLTNEYLNMRLIPVRVTIDSNSSVTEVKHQFLFTGVTLKSGSNQESPMKINAVFSGF